MTPLARRDPVGTRRGKSGVSMAACQTAAPTLIRETLAETRFRLT